MQGSEILTKAADRIKMYGWAQGSHARDTEERPVRVTATDAAYWSVYGAVMKEMANAGLIAPGGDDKAVQGFMPMWEVLTREARKARRVNTHVHPLFDYNDDPARTQAGVIEFLLDCADKLEAIEKGRITV